MANVLRIGVNLSNQNWYGDQDYMQNMFDDPGFEPGQEGHLAYVGSGASSTKFTDTNNNGEATNFWNGATASVRTGTSAGDTFTVDTFTSGGTYTCSPSCPALNAGDVVALIQTGLSVQANGDGPGNLTTNWRTSDSAVGLSTAEKYEGTSSLAFNVSDGNSHNIQFPWDTETTTGGVCSNNDVTPCTVANETADCGAGNTCNTAPYANSGPWHPVVGSFEISLYALASGTSSGTPTVEVQLVRSGGTNVSHTFTLTNDDAWHKYTYTFTGTDTAASAQNYLNYTMTASNSAAESGATIYVDDVYLGRNESSATGFRDEVLTTLTSINPGSLRYMIPDTFNQSDAGYEGPSGCTPGAVVAGGCDFLKGPSGSFTGSSPNGGWFYASNDVYALANATAAVPWFSIPNVYSDADLKAFVDNACTAFTTYGFSQIWIEQSNEDWNGTQDGVKFGGGNSTLYGELAGRNFSVMSAEASSKCPSNASKIHYVAGNQACNYGVMNKVYAGASDAGYPFPNTSQYGADDATYNYGGTNNISELPDYTGTMATQAVQYATWFLDNPADYMFLPVSQGGNCVRADQSQLSSNQTMAVYETGPSDFDSPGSTEQSYLSQAGFPSAAWQGAMWILGTQALVPIQNSFELSQVEYGPGGGNPAGPLWGIDHDLDSDFGPKFPHLRPIALAENVINSAMGGSYYPVNISGVSGVYANAFEQGTDWSAVLVNTTSSSIPITVVFPSSGTVPAAAQTVLYSNGMTDNNEDSNDVYVGALPGGLTSSGQKVILTLPPDSIVALDPAAP